MNVPNNLDATVFVFKHKKTGEIQATYSPQFKDFETDKQWRHVGTLEPRLWIQAHWAKVDVNTELLDALKGLLEGVTEAINAGDWRVDGACDPEIDIERAKTAIKKAERVGS